MLLKTSGLAQSKLTNLADREHTIDAAPVPAIA
jgi:hypothetical protein